MVKKICGYPFYYYKRKKPKTKKMSRFAIGYWGNRYIRIGRYDIVLWKVNPIAKKKNDELKFKIINMEEEDV